MECELYAEINYQEYNMVYDIARFKDHSTYLFSASFDFEELRFFLIRKFWEKYPSTFYNSNTKDIEVNIYLKDGETIRNVETNILEKQNENKSNNS